MLPELALVKMLAAMLTVVLLALLVVWFYRYVQYRRTVRLAQMRWLHFDAAPAKNDLEAASFEWPASASAALLLDPQQHHAHILSPIIEERGRESMDSLGSARRDLRQQTHSFVSYGSVELP